MMDIAPVGAAGGTVGAASPPIEDIPPRDAIALELKEEESLPAGAVEEIVNGRPTDTVEGSRELRRLSSKCPGPGVELGGGSLFLCSSRQSVQAALGVELRRSPHRERGAEQRVRSEVNLPSSRRSSCQELGVGQRFHFAEILGFRGADCAPKAYGVPLITHQ
jgi:hypothetical protein